MQVCAYLLYMRAACASSLSTPTASAPRRSKGLFDWLAQQDADVVCVQETKAQRTISSATRCSVRAAITAITSMRRKKGYSGVAIYSRRKPDKVIDRLRLARVRRRGTLSRGAVRRLVVVSLYLPSGSSARIGSAPSSVSSASSCRTCARSSAARRDYILCGDWNIAHKRDRPAELALEPEELRLPARGARVARRVVRRRRLRRRVSRGQRGARPVHVVVEPRPGLGEERRLAHRLPDSQPAARGSVSARASTRSRAFPITRRS